MIPHTMRLSLVKTQIRPVVPLVLYSEETHEFLKISCMLRVNARLSSGMHKTSSSFFGCHLTFSACFRVLDPSL